MRRNHVRCLGTKGFHRLHYYEWGDCANPHVLVCVHGLTRNGRDFDFLAQALADRFRVICPDVAGRGASDWLDVKQDYGMVQYLHDMTTLVARIAPGPTFEISWVGTSMGGLIGILMAALPGNPIRRLVVNDVGMRVPKAALERLARYVGKDPRFNSLDELEAHTRRVSAPFGPLTDAQWRHLTEHNARRFPDGRWGYGYDPAIGDALQGELEDVDFSAHWDAIRCPTLVLRGAQSDVLLHETAQAMTERGPRAILVELDGVGHAPMLMNDEQVHPVREFLLRT